MTAIVDIIGREILDSRGNPTVEVDVVLEDGSLGRAAVPSGASTGTHEAVELRDGDKKRYLGKGVRSAVEAVNGEIFDALSGMDAEAQVKIDETMIGLDGTPNKARLGANAILGVSLAVAKAAAAANNLPLYRYVGGTAARAAAGADDEHHQRRRACRQSDRLPGIHDRAAGAQNLSPRRCAPARKSSTRCARRSKPPGSTPMSATRAALRPICRRRKPRSISHAGRSEKAGYEPGKEVMFALDCAASEFFKDGEYVYKGEGKTRSREQQAEYLADLAQTISDRVDRRWHGRGRHRRLENADQDAGANCQLVGDDHVRDQRGAAAKRESSAAIANSILVKVNQIGTLTETLAAVEMAHKAGYTAVMSHRSGETEDSTIADLAVATNCGQIKTGSLARSDRTAKYNQLLRIEEELGPQAVYPGLSAFKALRLGVGATLVRAGLAELLSCGARVTGVWRESRWINPLN